MAGKSKKARERAIKAEEELKKAQEELEKAQAEDKKTVEEAKTHIDLYCKNKRLFCGNVFKMEDLLVLVQLFASGNPIVKIPYSVFIDDMGEEEEEENEIIEEDIVVDKEKFKLDPYHEKLNKQKTNKT